MTFTNNYADIIKPLSYFKTTYPDNFEVENNIIEKVETVVTGHFGNTVSLSMACKGVCPIPLYNSTSNIGYILRALIEIFDKEQDSSVPISALHNTPIRIVYADYKAIAIGHYMEDRFVLIEDLMTLNK